MTRTLHAVASLDERMGGSVRAALDTCRELEKRGQRTVVVATAAPGDSHEYLAEEYPSVSYRLFRRRFPGHYSRAPALRRWLQSHITDFDVVELHGVFSFVPLYVAWSCHKNGIPYTVRPHGSLDPFDLQKHSLFKWLYGRLAIRPMLRHASCVVLTSRLESERLETYGANPRRVVIPLPVANHASAGNGSKFRKEHGVPGDALVVLFLGRITQKKGLQFLIPALAALKAEFSSLWFLLAGGGDDRASKTVDSLITGHNIAGWTSRCGFVSGSEKQSAFAASDIFALPSLNENQGIAIVEAMQASLAVVISNQVYIHDILAERGAVLVCDPSVDSCAATIRRVIADDALREELGRRAWIEADLLFGPDATIPQLVQLYTLLAPT